MRGEKIRVFKEKVRNLFFIKRPGMRVKGEESKAQVLQKPGERDVPGDRGMHEQESSSQGSE